MKINTTIKKDIAKKIMEDIKKATRREVLIGIPATKAERGDDADGKVNNAMLGYINEYGSPVKHIPARPWLRPAIESIKKAAILRLKQGMEQALEGAGRPSAIERALGVVGHWGEAAAKNRIMNKIPPGLSAYTLRKRIARKQGSGVRIDKGAKAELAYRAENPAAGLSTEFTTPLIDTSKMVNAIGYVIRDKK